MNPALQTAAYSRLFHRPDIHLDVSPCPFTGFARYRGYVNPWRGNTGCVFPPHTEKCFWMNIRKSSKKRTTPRILFPPENSQFGMFGKFLGWGSSEHPQPLLRTGLLSATCNRICMAEADARYKKTQNGIICIFDFHRAFQYFLVSFS